MNGTTLVLDSVSGEAGTPEQLTVAWPSRSGVTHVKVNGANATMTRVGGNVVHVDVTFAGAAFRHLQPVIAWDSSFAGGRVTGTR